MTEWDRKTLLRLVDEAAEGLNTPELSVTQRHSLQSLMAHFGDKAKSIHASGEDVLAMQGQLTDILSAGNGES